MGDQPDIFDDLGDLDPTYPGARTGGLDYTEAQAVQGARSPPEDQPTPPVTATDLPAIMANGRMVERSFALLASQHGNSTNDMGRATCHVEDTSAWLPAALAASSPKIHHVAV